MNNYLKAYIYSPILGGAFSGILFCIYSLFITTEQLTKEKIFSITELIATSITIFPILIVLNIIVFYIISMPLLKIVDILKNKYFLKNGHTWAIMFFLGLILGLFIAFYLYQLTPLLGRSILVVVSLSFGLMFTSSLFSVLTDDTQKLIKN